MHSPSPMTSQIFSRYVYLVITLLVVEQSTNRALENADRIYVLRSGEITMSGRSADLSDADVEEAYFGYARAG